MAIGCTLDQTQRRYDHEHHASSIRIMNLVESIVRVEIDTIYSMQFLSLYSVPFARLADMAELVILRLCGSYLAESEPNVLVGGKSVKSANAVTADVYKHIQSQLGPKYGLRTQATQKKVREELEFMEYSSEVAELEKERKQLQDGLEKERQKHVDVEQRYIVAERELDNTVDAYLADDKARCVKHLWEESRVD
jgi:hypothetical protein